MTRRPIKPRRAKKAPAGKRIVRRRMARKPKRLAVQPEPLDIFIVAGARALNLTIAKAWLPAVRNHLQVTLHLGALVAAFPLPDDAEPAPVFEA